MELVPDSAEDFRGPFADLIEQLTSAAKPNIILQEVQTDRREGRLEGLQRCRDLQNATLAEFEQELTRMKDLLAANSINSPIRTLSREDYLQKACAIDVMEDCYRLLRVAHMAMGGVLPEDGMGDPSKEDVFQYDLMAFKQGLDISRDSRPTSREWSADLSF